MSERRMLTEAEIAEIRARTTSATPGPWLYQCDAMGDGIFTDWSAPGFAISRHYGNSPERDHTQMPRDAEFIAHSRTDVPRLLEALDAKDVEIARLRERMADVLIWASGCPDFNEGGQARDGWLRLAKPLLDVLLAETEARDE